MLLSSLSIDDDDNNENVFLLLLLFYYEIHIERIYSFVQFETKPRKKVHDRKQR